MKTSAKYQAAKYQVWKYIAAAARPVSRANIAAGVGLPEESVQGLIWCLEYRDDAIRSVAVRERVNPEEPCWVAYPDIELRADGSIDGDETVDVEEAESAGRTDMPDWSPCELARIYGLVPRQRAASKRPSPNVRLVTHH